MPMCITCSLTHTVCRCHHTWRSSPSHHIGSGTWGHPSPQYTLQQQTATPQAMLCCHTCTSRLISLLLAMLLLSLSKLRLTMHCASMSTQRKRKTESKRATREQHATSHFKHAVACSKLQVWPYSCTVQHHQPQQSQWWSRWGRGCRRCWLVYMRHCCRCLHQGTVTQGIAK